MKTKIEWASDSENPFKILVEGEMKGYHCTKVSEGCLRCYGEGINYRFGNSIPYDGRNVEFVLDRKILDRVIRYRKPRRLFWQSMGDLFHEGIPGPLINEVWRTMFNTPQHRHIVLTKRPERLKAWTERAAAAKGWPINEIWPDWIWLGVTAENQERADERIPVLVSIPAAVHFVSIEPCLGPVDLGYTFAPAYRAVGGKAALDWVILGCETGPGRRAMLPRWARDVKDQCAAAGVPFFYKQAYRNDGTLWKLPELDGRTWEQYPAVAEGSE